MANFHIGISGWRYRGWRGTFYPDELPQRRELEFASSRLNSIEINGSFYSLQRPSSYQQWRATVPPGFLFSVKCSRYITHLKRLKDIDAPLANFYASGVLALRETLGPFLWQFPPNMIFDAERFEAFFEKLPRTTADAAKLAANHDTRMKPNMLWLEPGETRPLRHAIEVRHSSFLNPKFFDLLRAHNIAFVLADTAGRWPYAEEITSDFIYARLHGDAELYVSGYSDTALDWWAERLHTWQSGHEPSDAKRVTTGKLKVRRRDVYVYFDNDAKVRAPVDALALASRLGVNWPAAA